MIKLVIAVALGLAFVSACGAVQKSQSRSSRPLTQRPANAHVTVVRDVDGDTIKVQIDGQQKSVRLIGIDTPETHKPGVKVECGGREASANMAKLAPAGSTATLVYDPTQDRVDRYGRLLAYVSVNHRSLQLEQLYNGWAEVYVYGKRPFKRVETYRSAAGVAQRAHRGVWSKCSGDFHSEQPAS